MSGSSPNPSGNESAEVTTSAKGYVHPPSYYHDVDNHGLPFKEVKHHHLKLPLQQLQDRNGPDAMTIIDMIWNPPPLFSLMTMISTFLISVMVEMRLTRVEMRLMMSKIGDKVNYSQKVEECVSIPHMQTEEEKNK